MDIITSDDKASGKDRTVKTLVIKHGSQQFILPFEEAERFAHAILKACVGESSHESSGLHLQNVSGCYCMYCEKKLKPSEAIVLCKKCTE